MAKRTRARFLQIMLTDDELDQLRAAAEERALPLSGWARMILLLASTGVEPRGTPRAARTRVARRKKR
jgi:hypothetical protein